MRLSDCSHGLPLWGCLDVARKVILSITEHNISHPASWPIVLMCTNDSFFSGRVIGGLASRSSAKFSGGIFEMTLDTLTGSEALKMCGNVIFLLP